MCVTAIAFPTRVAILEVNETMMLMEEKNEHQNLQLNDNGYLMNFVDIYKSTFAV